MAPQTTIILCRCAVSHAVAAERVLAAESNLRQRGIAFVPVEDLCGLCASRDARLAQWSSQPNLRVIACAKRAVTWLFDWALRPLRDDAEVVSLRQMPNAKCQLAIEQQIGRAVEPATVPDGFAQPEQPAAAGNPQSAIRNSQSEVPNPQSAIDNLQSNWVPWFPVIDYSRCVNCKQCVGFCLFGVYHVGPSGKVEVAKPTQCKNNCPACARVCPHTAIIFPKYAQGPINGDGFASDDPDGAKTRVDVAAVTSNDLYQSLRRRQQGEEK